MPANLLCRLQTLKVGHTTVICIQHAPVGLRYSCMSALHAWPTGHGVWTLQAERSFMRNVPEVIMG